VAAPTFVQASTGATDATGAFTFTGVATGTIGDLVVIHILVDGTGAIAWGTLSAANINALDGTANTWTLVGTFNIGSATNAQQRIYMGRRTSASAAPTFVASANTSGDDVYGRMYEFTNVSTGTTLATVIENGVGLSWLTLDASGQPIQGAGGVQEQQAQSFTSPSGATTLTNVALYVVKNGTPTDNLIIEIQTDSAGVPSGSVVGTVATIPGASVPVGGFTYMACSISLSSSTTYWIVLRRDGARDTTNRYVVNRSVDNFTGSSKPLDSGVWGAGSTSDWNLLLAYSSDQGQTAHAGTSATINDAAVATLGPDRLALNFVGINDDNAVAAFTGMIGGTWAEATAEYADAGGTDACIQLQTAAMAAAGVIDGGSTSNVDATDGWGSIGFALIGTTVASSGSLLLPNPTRITRKR
jgi:hypothetical protein